MAELQYGEFQIWSAGFDPPQYGVPQTGRFFRKCTRASCAFYHTVSLSSHTVQRSSNKRSQFFQSISSGTIWFSHCLPSRTITTHFQLHNSFSRKNSEGCTSESTALLSKQGTSGATSSRTGSAKITTISPCKAQMEKKTLVQSTDKGKKLNCLKSLYETRNKQQHKIP